MKKPLLFLAISSFIFGIVGLFTLLVFSALGLFSLIALLLGHISLWRIMKKGKSRVDGKIHGQVFTITGLIFGYIGVFWLIVISLATAEGYTPFTFLSIAKNHPESLQCYKVIEWVKTGLVAVITMLIVSLASFVKADAARLHKQKGSKEEGGDRT